MAFAMHLNTRAEQALPSLHTCFLKLREEALEDALLPEPLCDFHLLEPSRAAGLRYVFPFEQYLRERWQPESHVILVVHPRVEDVAVEEYLVRERLLNAVQKFVLALWREGFMAEWVAGTPVASPDRLVPSDLQVAGIIFCPPPG